MKLSAKDLLDLKIIDEIISEPVGGAHRDRDLILDKIRSSITNNLQKFDLMSKEEIFNHRKNKFLSIGRTKGFISQSVDTKTLSMKLNIVDNLKAKIFKNKNELIIIIAALLLITLFYYLL